jgi:hypothetical protein
MGKSVGVGMHNLGVGFYNQYYQSTLKYPLFGTKLNMNTKFSVHNFIVNYNFQHGNYSGYMWDNDYQQEVLINRIKAWSEGYSNLHLLKFGYLAKDNIVKIKLFICQHWAIMEHNMRNGQVFINNGWIVDKYIYDLDSYYTEKSQSYGIGIDIDFWKIETEFNYFHKVKVRGQGWWNLRDMVFTVYNYADMYDGKVKFVYDIGKFFTANLSYMINLSYFIGDGFEDNETRFSGHKVENECALYQNTKFYHSIGFSVSLKI